MTAAAPVLFLHHLGGMRNGAFGKTNDFAERLAQPAMAQADSA
jgi:hypothetical protein